MSNIRTQQIKRITIKLVTNITHKSNKGGNIADDGESSLKVTDLYIRFTPVTEYLDPHNTVNGERFAWLNIRGF